MVRAINSDAESQGYSVAELHDFSFTESQNHTVSLNQSLPHLIANRICLSCTLMHAGNGCLRCLLMVARRLRLSRSL